LIKVENHINKYLGDSQNYHLVDRFYRGLFKEWATNQKLYTVADGLILEKTKFPSAFQYQLEVRRTIGISISNVYEDKASNEPSPI
jgi:hypothetical protein